MHLRSFGLGVCMLLFAASPEKTGSEESEGGKTKVGAASQTQGDGKITVKLLDPGAEPRTALR